MKHVLTALCTRALIDQLTDGTTLVELVDGLFGAPGAEGILPVALDLVSIWSRSNDGQPESGTARVGVFAPDGDLLGQYVEYEIDLRSNEKVRNVTRFPGFPIRGLGPHRIVVELESSEDNWVQAAEWPVRIATVAAPATTLG